MQISDCGSCGESSLSSTSRDVPEGGLGVGVIIMLLVALRNSIWDAHTSKTSLRFKSVKIYTPPGAAVYLTIKDAA